jgi:hypothetical protein
VNGVVVWSSVALGAAEAVVGAVWLWCRWRFARGLRWFRVSALTSVVDAPRVAVVTGTVVDEQNGVQRQLLRTSVPVQVDDVVRCGPVGTDRARLLPTPRTVLPGSLAVRGALLVAFGLAVENAGPRGDVIGDQPGSFLLVAWMFTLFGVLSAGITIGRLRFSRIAREVEGVVVDERRWLSQAPSEPKVRYTVYGRTRSAWVGRYTFFSPRVGKSVVVLVDPRTDASARRVYGSLGIGQFLGGLAGILGVLQYLGVLGLFG